jgi:hypothetical protein
MTAVLRIRDGAAAALIAAASLSVLAVPAAHASVNPYTCTYGTDMSVPRISATCYANPNPNGWYLRESCEMHTGKIIYVNGTISYAVGWGTSNAVCPAWTELGESELVNL